MPSGGLPHALAGRFLGRSREHAGGPHAYKVYIPAGYTGAPLPLVVMLHGGGQSAQDFAASTRMNSVADHGSFLVAYPEQTTGANSMRYWNWFHAAHQRRGAGEPALIAGITRDVMTSFAVDSAQVYIAGFSAGGAMAAVMAANYPDLYAAAGIHSGMAYRSAQDVGSALSVMRQGPSRAVRLPRTPIPLIVFHGDRDQSVGQVNGDQIVAQWRASAPLSAYGSPSVRHGRAPGGGRSYSQTVYPDPGGGPAIEHWVVAGGGHAWFGGRRGGSYTDPAGPDASAEIARFFAGTSL